jgi:hypothetical protein
MSGTWVAASKALGRPIKADESYPHICGRTVRAGTVSGRPVRLTWRDCAACWQDRQKRR